MQVHRVWVWLPESKIWDEFISVNSYETLKERFLGCICYEKTPKPLN